MSGLSPTEIIVAWAEGAVQAAVGGAVCEENLRALLGSPIDSDRSSTLARDGYLAMLNALGQVEDGLVMKLIVPLVPRDALPTEPPSAVGVENEVDLQNPPSFVVHRLMPRRDWEPVEEYRRPVDSNIFFDVDSSVADGLYIAFRSSWEIGDDAPYRRQLLFEHLCTSVT